MMGGMGCSLATAYACSIAAKLGATMVSEGGHGMGPVVMSAIVGAENVRARLSAGASLKLGAACA